MNLRDLEYVCAVERHRHFGQAAKACHVSQPTLSSQILKLEDELGVVIFERIRKSVSVTQAGAKIIAAAARTVQASNEIKQIAAALRDPFAAEFALGIIPTIGPFLLPFFSAPLTQSLPQLTLSYVEDTTERLTAELLNGEIDAAILATAPIDKSLTMKPLYRERFHAVLPKGHALCRKKSISLRDLEKETLLLLTEGHCLRDQALSVCKNTRQNDAIRATSLDTLVGLVAGGHGATLIPAMAVRAGLIAELNICIRPIRDASAARNVNITYRRSFTRPALIDAFINILTDAAPATGAAHSRPRKRLNKGDSK